MRGLVSVALEAIARLCDEQIGIAAKIGQSWVGTGVTGVGHSETRGCQAHSGIGHEVWKRHALQPEWAHLVCLGGERVPVKDVLDSVVIVVLQPPQPVND